MSKANNPGYETELQKFYSEEYLKLLNLDSIKDKELKAKLSSTDLRFWSHKNRIVRNIQIMKHTFLMEKTNMVTTCFKATYKATSCIYGYLYSRHIPSPRGPGDVEHGYVCNSPTYRSQDGEYRHRLLPYTQFDALWNKYYEILEKVEKMILRKMNSGKLEFQTDFYYPASFTYHERKFEDLIDEQRIPIKLFAICWLFDFYQIHNRIIENHVNPAYQYVIYNPDDIPLYDEIIEKLGHDKYRRMMARISRYYADIEELEQNIIELEVGQKIFPLTVWEAIKLDDINFNVWREIYFTNMCSNLVVNMISPSFPFINNWFYIQNTHGGLFDNLAMHEKYRHSEIATDISTQLKNVDKYNYVSADMSKGPVNNRFMRLSKYIQKSIMYVDSAIKLTELAICMTSEYVGRTLRDIPVLIAHDSSAPSLTRMFTELDMFSKHMFEFIHGFYCMNTKAGLFHGDLHMNNATINRLYHVLDPANGEPVHESVKDPRVVYILSADEAYMFKHYGAFSTIIDFSRAIMGNYAKLEHEFGPRFADQYFREQRFRVMQIVYHYFPKVMDKYREQIEGLLITNFELMFKILTAIDTFVICSNIAAMISIDEAFTRGKIKLAGGLGRFTVRIIQLAEATILSNLQAAIDGKIKSVDDLEWPNLVILRQCFDEFRITGASLKKQKVDILDIFNYNNDVLWDVEDYSTWGPMLSIDKEIELRKKYGLDIHVGIKKWMRFKDIDETIAIDSLVSKYEAQEKDLIQFESWMLL